ncbi:right-handed parallel beta-helix repeat-containing protein [Arthrobacter bambusae]|uniref:right-handed parallel beta-helix repeat-containing protein n=1 Tax=Arthrobacter bambusae TaxID=1338426 RepID=UPI0027828141|nr:right-handed parallel beta-helix repeat-containing protein [Arthrobacter bambusae]MDQ0031453.1 parallel beta-helix repeat protein [Arthrobacter bambusae]MDQ0099659.1 parallel beta-helix repeat protein [Arthrobacter bambusae]
MVSHGSGTTFDPVNWAWSPTFALALVGGKAPVRKDELIINVRDYGALGDGVADDTTAIQAAIAASAKQLTSSGAGAGRPVFFPAGRYKVTSTITVPTGTVLEGASGGVWNTNKGESRIFMSNLRSTLIANADQTNGDSDIEIRHLKLMGSGGNVLDFKASGAGGTDGVTCRRILIVDCYITNTAGNGIRFSDVQVSQIRGCYVSGNTGHSIYFQSSYDNEITGCQIDTFQGATGAFGGDGIHMDNTGGSAGYSDYNIIHNNFIFLCTNGIGITSGRGNVITGNRINTCNYGIMMQTFGGATNIERNLVTGNAFYDHGYKTGGVGVLIDGTSQYNTVSVNQFSRETGSGFNYAVQTGATASNNVVNGNAARNMVQGKSFNDSSSNTNTYINNSVAERGMRVSTVLTSAGVVAFDASLTNSFQVTLQANATSSTLTNGHQGQQITICWLQDATGGRTYSWPTNCRFAGGSAPSNTTANRQTSATFMLSGSLWMEIGRAVQVG